MNERDLEETRVEKTTSKEQGYSCQRLCGEFHDTHFEPPTDPILQLLQHSAKRSDPNTQRNATQRNAWLHGKNWFFTFSRSRSRAPQDPRKHRTHSTVHATSN